MPIYEYRCSECSKAFERIQKLNDPAPACPACGKSTERMVSLSSFQFNGTGFYTTDYARKGSAAPATAASPSSGESTSGGD
jgi:putative FmdB family regulatory protein